MPIEQVFLIALAGAFGAGVLWWFKREQRLARSRVTITSGVLTREWLEDRYVRYVADGGRDPHNVFADHIACQPQHLGWTMSLWFAESHDELGRSVLVASTRLDKVRFVPFPKQHPMWQVVDRYYELPPRMRGFVKEVRSKDPGVGISIDLEMFE